MTATGDEARYLVELCWKQGCQMVYFQTKTPNYIGYIWEGLGIESVVICIFWSLGIF
jgi:hypothetical protein